MTEKRIPDTTRLQACRQEWTTIANDDLKDAKRVQQWTVFYLIATAIALLGVAFETGPPGHYPVLDIAELIAWVALAISASAGLHYVRKIPNLYVKGAKETTARGQSEEGELYRVMGMDTLSISGEAISVHDYIERQADQAEKIATEIKPLSDAITRTGKLQFWSFVIGLVLLGTVRAGPPAIEATTLLFR